MTYEFYCHLHQNKLLTLSYFLFKHLNHYLHHMMLLILQETYNPRENFHQFMLFLNHFGLFIMILYYLFIVLYFQVYPPNPTTIANRSYSFLYTTPTPPHSFKTHSLRSPTLWNTHPFLHYTTPSNPTLFASLEFKNNSASPLCFLT